MDLKKFATKRAGIGLALGAAVLLVGGYAIATHTKGSDGFGYVPVTRGDLSAEVRLDGVVKPATAVDLAFESSGAVASVSVKANQAVKAGQILATLRGADASAAYAQAAAGVQAAQAQVTVAEAAVATAQAQLAQAEHGATPQELAAAQSALDDAKAKAAADLSSSTSSAIAAAQASVADARSALLTLTDIQYAFDRGSSQDAFVVEQAKGAAVLALFGVSGAGSWDRVSVSGLDSGLYASVRAWKSDAPTADVIARLADLEDALRSVANALSSVPVTDAFTSADLAAMNGASALANGDLRAIAADLTSIKTQEAENASSVNAAQDHLDIVNAGSRPEVLDAANANVRRAQADLASAKARVAQADAARYAASATLGKTVLRSPLNGIVTHVDAKVGQFATASVPLISLMSAGAPQIETYAAQTDVAALEVGQAATFTLDAIPGETFDATVASVDAAPTDVSGTPSYKVTLALAKDDPRVKTGLDANVRVGSATRVGVLFVPKSALIRRANATYVIVNDHGAIQREVDTGLVSEDGKVEIIRGLQEGDQVAQFGAAN